jgi:hypothetical protein
MGLGNCRRGNRIVLLVRGRGILAVRSCDRLLNSIWEKEKMARKTVEPELIDRDETHGDRYTHPAFGQISVSRVSGGHTSLYDSDFGHRGYVVVRIARSELCRSLSRDWHFSSGLLTNQIAEIAMSEAQWATFVSSFNSGSGVPCTLQVVHGEQQPGLPPRDEKDQYAPEVQARIDRASAALEALKNDLAAGTTGMPKGKAAAMMEHVDTALREFRSNVPFVVKSFGEHVETRMEKAKVEIHGWMNATVQRAGLQAITQREGSPLLLERDDSDQEREDGNERL